MLFLIAKDLYHFMVKALAVNKDLLRIPVFFLLKFRMGHRAKAKFLLPNLKLQKPSLVLSYVLILLLLPYYN